MIEIETANSQRCSSAGEGQQTGARDLRRDTKWHALSAERSWYSGFGRIGEPVGGFQPLLATAGAAGAAYVGVGTEGAVYTGADTACEGRRFGS